MKKFQKIFALLLALSLIFASCAPKEEAKKDEPAKEEAKKEEAKQDEPAKEETAEDGKVELVYWSMWNATEPQAIELQKGFDAYMAAHPDVVIKPEWKGRELRNIITAALDNGEKIDFWENDVELVTKKWNKYALPLDSYIDASYEQIGGKPYREAVLASLLGLAKGFSEDGQTYALPYQPYLLSFFYNKAHFEEAGIEKVPTTWEEFDEVCAKLKEAGFTPITVDDAYAAAPIGMHLARLKGADWVGELVKDTHSELWNDEAVLKTAKAWEDFYKKGYIDPNVATNKFPQGQQDLGMGMATMYLNGSWLPNEIRDTAGPDFKWGSFNYPAVEGGVDGINAANFGSQAFQINKDCANPDIAFDLLVSLTTGEVDEQIASATMGIPVGVDSEWPAQLAEAKAIFEQLDTVYPWEAGIEGNDEKTPILREEFVKLATGEVTAEEFVENLK